MFTVIVSIRVKQGRLEEFLAAITENAEASLRDEPGCLRFDVHQDADDPLHFVLHEIYADEAAFRDAHQAASHYHVFRDLADEILDERVNTFGRPIYLTDGGST
jgi:autoinducer 2-degrading protein